MLENTQDASDTQDEQDVKNSLVPEDEEANLASGATPQLFRQATTSPDAPEWWSAMETQLNSISELGTYKLVELPAGMNVIGTTWTYRIKHDGNGEITEHKARLVAQGFTQKPGIDFQETFAPVARIDSIHLIAGLAASLDWEIHVVDIDSAFLNSELPNNAKVYVCQPQGFETPGKEHLVWRLRKALYGLKQSGYLWYQKLKSIVLLLKDQIRSHVSIKDAGDISLLLGIEVT